MDSVTTSESTTREPLWVVDDEPSRRFPIYTRGNTGEVYPNVITPLCGSIVKGPIALGQAQAFREMGAVVAGDLDETDRAVLTGCFGGYLYANLSIGRLMGARAPGMKPSDVDTQMFGTSDAPPYRRQPGDRNLRATARLAGLMTRALRGPDFSWLAHERADIAAWTSSRPDPRHASTDELLATVDQGAAHLPSLMRSLLLASAFGGIGASLIERLAANADPVITAKTAGGVGDVESAGPAGALWHLARLVGESPALTAAFDAGPGIWERIDALGAAAQTFRDSFDEFLARFGSRGPDEWELASHTWATDPDIALAAVERLRHTNAPDPATVAARLAAERADALETVRRSIPAPARRVFVRAAQTVAEGAAGRERAKGTIMLAAFSMRLALFELIRRAQEAGAPDHREDCWLVTRGELESFIDRPAEFGDVIAARATQRDLLQARIPPFVFEGRIPDPMSWPLRSAPSALSVAQAGDQLAGLGVSPGVARGRVRVITDPADPGRLEPGDVLVAPITDPAWTPLFLVANAVVCDVGANLSHAAIVARELGIPAVVAVPHATERLGDGSTIEVDGTTGSITVLTVPPGSARR